MHAIGEFVVVGVLPELDDRVRENRAVVAASKPGRDEVEEMVELKIEDALGRLADLLSERMAPPAAPETPVEIPKDAAPASVKKSRKQKTFAERYYFGDRDDD